MKPLIVISSDNAASQNIKGNLLGICGFSEKGKGFWESGFFDMEEFPGGIIGIVPEREASCYIYASTHRSERGGQCLTAHTPGNWGANDLGGEKNSLNVACAGRLMAAARKLFELSQASLSWQVSVEADHHGPTLNKPLLFVEIGSSEKEWENRAAGKIAAHAIVAAAESGNAKSAYVGFGGGHYCPKFTPLILSGTPIGHIISGYALEKDGISEEMVKQALSRCAEPVEGALVDWKGIKGEARKKLIGALEGLGVAWKRA